MNGFSALATLSEEDFALSDRAYDRLVTDCMLALGYDYRAEPAGADGAARRQFEAVPTLDEIATSGYAWRDARFQAASEATASSPQPLSDEAGEALGGPGGCGEQAVARVGLQRLDQVVQELYRAEAEAWKALPSDPVFLQVEQAWADCMREVGRQYSTIEEAERGVDVLPGGVLGAEAIRLATDDFRCRFSTGLIDVRLDIIDEAAAQWVERNPQQVEALTDARVAIVEQSLRILES